MVRAQVCMIAGLALAAIMPANASAQDCPEWLMWACSKTAPSGPVRELAPSQRQRARTPAGSNSQMDPATKHARAALDATMQKTKRLKTTHAVGATRNTGSSDPSGDQRPARYGHDGAIDDRERDALFENFSAWQKARRLDADARSNPSGDPRPVVMNDQEKEELFQKFSAWQRARRLNADANR
jgi:hypothetical protein